MDATFETMFRDEVCTVSMWRAVLVLAWHRAPTLATVTSLSAALPGLARRAPHGVVLCALISEHAGLPDAKTREAVQRAVAQFEDQMVASLNVVLGSGFQAAAIRAVVAGLMLVMRQKRPSTVVANEREAALFVCNQWPAKDLPLPTPAQIERALEAIAPR